METIEDVKKDVLKNERILGLVDYPDAEFVPFKSGKNHPWHRTNSFFFNKDINSKRYPRYISNDYFHTDRNLRWWNNYIPQYYEKCYN